MAQFDDLPELVISIIIGTIQRSYNAGEELATLSKRLVLIAIDQTWRKVGVSRCYQSLIFQNESASSNQKPASNIALFTKPEYRKLVTALLLTCAPGSPMGTGIPVDLFDFMMRDIIQNSFGVGNILPKICLSGTMNGGYKGELILKVVERFVEWFPHVNFIDMTFENINSGVTQFATRLVDAFGKQLRSLGFGSGVLDIRHLPKQLTVLACPGEEQILSKISLQPLGSLTVYYVPTGFSWSFFQSETESDTEVRVFPNLKRLDLCRVSDDTANLPSSSRVTSISPRLQFPKLSHLRLEVFDDHSFDFDVEVIPEHLSCIDYVGCTDSVCVLGKLPAKSAYMLGILVTDVSPQFTNDFYNTLSFLFGRLKVVRSARLEMKCDVANFDLQQVNLANVTLLDISMPTPEKCRDWLQACPNILGFKASFTPEFRQTIGDRDLAGLVFPELTEHKVRYLIIHVKRDVNSVRDRIIDYSICLLKSMKNLWRVEVTEYYGQGIWLKAQKSRHKFPHLGKIDITLLPY